MRFCLGHDPAAEPSGQHLSSTTRTITIPGSVDGLEAVEYMFQVRARNSAGFVDVDPGGAHAAAVGALFAAGITVGCSQEPLRSVPARM